VPVCLSVSLSLCLSVCLSAGTDQRSCVYILACLFACLWIVCSQVAYNTKGWLLKNQDPISDDTSKLFVGANVPLVATIWKALSSLIPFSLLFYC
jgi:hypothetical protein